MPNQSYFHTMKFNLEDYDLGDLGLGEFSLGDFNLGDSDLIPDSTGRSVFSPYSPKVHFAQHSNSGLFHQNSDFGSFSTRNTGSDSGPCSTRVLLSERVDVSEFRTSSSFPSLLFDIFSVRAFTVLVNYPICLFISRNLYSILSL